MSNVGSRTVAQTVPKPHTQGRILVIRGGAIGDFILTLPVFRALKMHFPDTHLEVLGYPHIASLALLAGSVDAVRPIESAQLAGFFGRPDRLDPDWSAYFATFHVIISYLYDPDGCFRENVGTVTQAQFLAGPHRPLDTSEDHASNQLLEPLKRLAIFDGDPTPHIPIPADKTEPRLVIHPGSGSESKNWPEQRWSELLRWILEQTDLELCLVGGEAEGERLERLRAVLHDNNRVRILRNRPLNEIAVLMAASTGFLGHDSGLSHLAAAVGCRGLVLWGPTQEQVWRPLSDRVVTLRHRDGLQGLPLAVVQEQLREILDEFER